MNRGLWASGLWHDNPALVKLLGLCPLLAVSNTSINALALGLATLLTLLITNLLVSVSRKLLHSAIRIPLYVLVIASTVSAIELLVKAWLPALNASLGIFLPLIVTNCLIIGRAEAFASRQTVSTSFIDALAMGFGFLWVLVLLGAVREMIGQGTLLADATMLFGTTASHWTVQVFSSDHALLVALLPPGSFFALGGLLALKNLVDIKQRTARQSVSDLPSFNPNNV